MRVYFLTALVFFSVSPAWAAPSAEDIRYYRELTLALRTQAVFKVAQITSDHYYDYSIEFGEPAYAEPLTSELPVFGRSDLFFRNFWDRIFLKDGSRVILNGEEIPLTCVFVSGQDNRYAGLNDPRIPEFVMKVYLVANDYSCVGPINPGWPENGGKKETWETYVYYEVIDPTIMLPVEPKIKYRGNEFHSVLMR